MNLQELPTLAEVEDFDEPAPVKEPIYQTDQPDLVDFIGTRGLQRARKRL